MRKRNDRRRRELISGQARDGDDDDEFDAMERGGRADRDLAICNREQQLRRVAPPRPWPFRLASPLSRWRGRFLHIQAAECRERLRCPRAEPGASGSISPRANTRCGLSVTACRDSDPGDLRPLELLVV